MLEMKIRGTKIQASLEFEELSVAQEFGYEPLEWDKLPVTERSRLIAFARDHAALEHIGNMSVDARRSLRGATEWTSYDEES